MCRFYILSHIFGTLRYADRLQVPSFDHLDPEARCHRAGLASSFVPIRNWRRNPFRRLEQCYLTETRTARTIAFSPAFEIISATYPYQVFPTKTGQRRGGPTEAKWKAPFKENCLSFPEHVSDSKLQADGKVTKPKKKRKLGQLRLFDFGCS